MDALERLREIGVLPVVTVDDPAIAVEVVGALVEGGLPAVEIAFRTEVAADSLRRVAEWYPKVLVAGGTILNVEQARAAMDAGAHLIASPALSERVVRHCEDQRVATLPGVCTPTEVGWARSLGLEVVRFFPAEPMGGTATVRALAGPFPRMRFVPTGGLHEGNLRDYLGLSSVWACAGSWPAPSDLISERDFNRITELTRAVVAAVQEFRALSA